uniref:PGA_cap domain-containing protein n=1 Tax=Globodera pallida TaxID=36090 RepID=A0A183BY44_GLOPA
MTGRGVDQILPYPSESHLHEQFVKNAKDYVRLAERHSGPLPKRRDFSYPWGDALAILDEWKPNVRIINLETSVTTSEDNWPHKGINYRMHPNNVPCLTSAYIDCCVLANNHVLDWGHKGLAETISVLRQAGIRTVGAGGNESEADAPAAIELGHGRRLLVFAWGDDSSGVPSSWAANASRGGVNFLPSGISSASAETITRRIGKIRRSSGDVVVASLHWGGNWGYDISKTERSFAHQLIDSGNVDIVYGHSSHHSKAIEVYKDKLILYGCGDFLNDYEGISGYEEFHAELTLMYFPVVNAEKGTLVRLDAAPMKINKLRLTRATVEDALWLYQTMARECAKFGVRVLRDEATNVHQILVGKVSSTCHVPRELSSTQLVHATCSVTLVEEKMFKENSDGEAFGFKMLVDCASSYEREKLEQTLCARGISPNEITHLVITHWHFDHCGNIGLFPTAQLITPERILAEGSEAINNHLPKRISVHLYGGHSTPGDVVVRVKQMEYQADKIMTRTTAIVGDLFEFENDWLFDQPWKQSSFCPSRQLISRFLCWKGADEIVPGHGPSFRLTTAFPGKSSIFGLKKTDEKGTRKRR